MKRLIKKIIIGLFLVILLLIISFVLWAVIPLKTMDKAVQALESNSSVEVIVGRDIVFMPKKASEKGLIIYPGTRVNSEAYAVLAQMIALRGVTVVLAQMPLDLSVLDIDRADDIIANLTDINSWSIAGHSMGGAMAAFYTKVNLDKIDGLIMLGSYPAESTDLSDTGIEFISIYSSEDFIASEEEILHKRHLSPIASEYYKIEGGNHAGFGYYGPQKGDGEAIISREEQHKIAAEKIVEFIYSIN